MRSRPARRRWFRAPARIVALALFVLTGWGLAFDPAIGTELLLADSGGRTLIGYGRITEEGLRLQLSHTTREVRVIVVAPDGEAVSYRGLLIDGRLTLEMEDRPPLDVADALAQDRRSLTLAREGQPEVVVPPRHGPAPAGPTPPVAGSENDEAQAASAAPEEPAAAGSAAGAPGRDGDAPGRSGDAPGRSGDAPGRSDDAPGRSEDAPGRSGDAPGRSEDAPGRSGDAPGRSGDAPGRSEDAPGRSDGAPGAAGEGDGDGGGEGGGEDPPADSGAEAEGDGSLLGVVEETLDATVGVIADPQDEGGAADEEGKDEGDEDLIDLVDLADGWL